MLDAAGYSRVNVVAADAENSVPERTPYDRIIVTRRRVGHPAGLGGTACPGGRIVVPLRMRGLTRSLAMDREGTTW